MNNSELALVSPRVKMDGWVHLPRFISKIRLHQAGKLPADYQPNLGKGFDSYWLEASGVNDAEFREIVRTKTDVEIEQWIKTNVKKSAEQIEAYNQKLLLRGHNDDVAEKFKERKAKAGLAHREDIKGFADLIDADEGRI
jgi:hypothetical protein